MNYINPETKEREQFYALCYEREAITGKNFAYDLKNKRDMIEHFRHYYSQQPFALPGQNQRIAHVLSEVFQTLGYSNKSFGSLMTNITDGKDSYRVWGISSHPKEEYKTLTELKKAIASGDVIVTGYCKRDQQYDAFISNINKLKEAEKRQVKQEYQYGLQTIRTLKECPELTNRIMSIKSHYKYREPMYGMTGYELTTKMDPSIIPYIDIYQEKDGLDLKYSDELLIVMSYLSFVNSNKIEAKRYINRLIKFSIPKHEKTLVEEAFASYLLSATTDDIDPNF